MALIREATENDLYAINKIYNQTVHLRMCTADIDPIDIEKRKKWFAEHDPECHPVFVAEDNRKVIGWISLSAYRPGRRALRFTAEVSYYVHQDYQEKGIGSKLLDHVIKNASDFNIKTLFAILLENNIPSIKLLEKFNFERWGYLPRVAEFDGKEVGQYYYGRRI